MRTARWMAVGLLLVVNVGRADAQNPIHWRVTYGGTVYDSLLTAIVDICNTSAWTDTTAYHRYKAAETPLTLLDGPATDCPGGAGNAFMTDVVLGKGTNWLVFTFTQYLGATYIDSASVIYVDTTTTLPSLGVPAAGVARLVPGQIHPLTFTIRNVGYTPASFEGKWLCSGNVSCSPSAGSTFTTSTLAVGAAVNATISVTPSSLGGTGTVRLVATGYPAGTSVDTATVAIEVNRPAVRYVSVTAMRAPTDTVRRAASTASAAYFRVANLDPFATRSVSLSVACGPASCTSGPTSVTLGPLSDTTVAYAFTMPASGSDSVRLSAQAADGGSSAAATVRFKVATAPPDTVRLFAIEPRPLSSVARGECLSVAAGPGAGVECGSLRLAYTFPPITTMGKARALRLLYLSEHAAPAVTVPVRVAIRGKTDSVSLVTTLSIKGGGGTPLGSVLDTVPWHRTCAMTEGCVLNMRLTTDTVPTGDYTYTVKVALASSPTVVDSLTGTVIVVHRRTSPFGVGWWPEGVEQLQKATRDTANRLWVGGDGSARLYHPVGGGKYVPLELVNRPDTLQRRDSSGVITWVRYLRDSARVIFDDSLRHVQTRNRERHVTTFRYASATSKLLTRIVLPDPSAVDSFPYRFGYDSSSGVPRLGIVSYQGGTGDTLSYLVHRDSNKVAIVEPTGDSILFVHAPGTRRVTTRYDRLGYATAFDYANGTVSRVRSPLQDTVTICPVEGRTVSACSMDPSAEAAIPVTRFRTAVDGPLSAAAGLLPDRTRFYVGAFGAVDTIVDPYGSTTRITRMAGAFPALVTRVEAPTGVITRATYNARGLPVTVVDSGGLGSGSAATTRYAWNATWDMADTIIPPLGPTTTFGIDASGNRVWQQVGSGDSTRLYVAYDALNRPRLVYGER